jgi:hypothetical protein
VTHEPSSSGPASGGAEADDRKMTPIYLRVIAVELVVLASLWLFSRYFG